MLIVEDAKEVAQLIALIIAPHVAQVTLRVERFDDLVNETDWNNIDVIICDRRLSRTVDGCDILAQVEQDHPEVGRILLTADTTAPFDECHADKVLSKPISVDRLTDAIAQVSGARK
ncbi:UNVERIFIED_CONTAM: response regulator [Kocuria sp. CPCC 205316]|uniref:response regulator n=1 Tax=Kocuria TaxID=57493 RepID=UPI0036DA775A